MADVTFVPITPPENSGDSLIATLFPQNMDIGGMLNTAFIIAIQVGSVLALLRLIWGGWLYMSSSAWSSKHAAKEVISNTIIGLLILLAVWIILYQINPQILQVSNFSRGG